MLNQDNLISHEEGIFYKRSHSKDVSNEMNKRITVCVRKKPVDEKSDISLVVNNNITIQSRKIALALEPYSIFHTFRFDKVINERSTNEEIFRDQVSEYAYHAINGGSSTIIAYGQTGTGKTYTMLDMDSGMLIQSIKLALSAKRPIRISIIEIYMGKITDCLKENQKILLQESQNEFYCTEIYQASIGTINDACTIINDGLRLRKSASIGKKEDSSRSHAVVFLDFNQQEKLENNYKKKKLHSNNCMIFIDLAGNERGADRLFGDKKLYMEGSEINKSLLSLKECIRGIVYGSPYKPFRSSKLTQILRNALVGDSKTLLIATVSTTDKNLNHTLNTLRYASRIKDLKNNENDDYLCASIAKWKNAEKPGKSYKVLENLNALKEKDLYDRNEKVYIEFSPPTHKAPMKNHNIEEYGKCLSGISNQINDNRTRGISNQYPERTIREFMEYPEENKTDKPLVFDQSKENIVDQVNTTNLKKKEIFDLFVEILEKITVEKNQHILDVLVTKFKELRIDLNIS